MMNLNVGCGDDPWGDVRVDVVRYSFRRRKQTTANVLADIQHLPFRDKTFVNTRCFHVLEHVRNPVAALREVERVSNGEIVIRVPIWHLYNFLSESFYLLVSFILIPLRGLNQLRQFIYELGQVKRWKIRYGDHKWYIRFRGGKLNKERWVPLPKEYEYVITKQRNKEL